MASGQLTAATGFLVLTLALSQSTIVWSFEGDSNTNKWSTFGNNIFGSWIEDEHGLPAFAINASQNSHLADIAYFTHQIGNDRVVALSTHGTVSLRQDEGSPKLLNDYVPEDAQVRGGFGYVSDGKTVFVSSRYDRVNISILNDPASDMTQKFSHTLGVGYYRKTATNNGVSVDEAVIAPFGDDPVIFIQSTISSDSSTGMHDLFYTMYFGDRMLELSEGQNHEGYGALVKSKITRYSRTGPGITAQGLLSMHIPPENRDYKSRTHPWPQSSRPPPTMYDEAPRPTFLVALDAPLSGWATSGKAFFGTPINVDIPHMLVNGGLDNSTSDTGLDTMLALSINLPTLSNTQKHTVYFIYGYLPNANSDIENATAELDKLLQRYTNGQTPYGSPETVWSSSSSLWLKEANFNITMPTSPWMSREVMWHSYALRSMLTYDSYFGEHILNQGGQYLYNTNNGFQGAARDPLCHGLPLTYGSGHRYFAEILRYTLKELRFCSAGQKCVFTDKGPACLTEPNEKITKLPEETLNVYPHYACGIPWGIWGNGEDFSSMWPSDLEQWLIRGVSEYVLATRAFELLDETITTQDGHVLTVREGTWHAYERFRDVIGFGKHGLCRLLHSDHNDGFLNGIGISGENFMIAELDGESVMNSAMATYILEKYALLLAVDNATPASNVSNVVDVRRKLLNTLQQSTWVEDKGWYARAYLGNEELGWVGRDEKALWIEPNSYALLGGVTEMFNTSDRLVKIIDANNRQPSPTGAVFSTDPRCHGVYRGVWYVGNWPLTLALGHLGYADMALEEWKKNSLANHASVYSDQWPGTCSGPDFYEPYDSTHPGKAASVFNAWTHTYPLATLPSFVGLSWQSNGFSFRPSLALTNYSIASSLIGFTKSLPASAKPSYSGWYNPPGAARKTENLTISFFLNSDEKSIFSKAKVDGKSVPLTTTTEGSLEFSVMREAGMAVHWELE